MPTPDGIVKPNETKLHGRVAKTDKLYGYPSMFFRYQHSSVVDVRTCLAAGAPGKSK